MRVVSPPRAAFLVLFNIGYPAQRQEFAALLEAKTTLKLDS